MQIKKGPDRLCQVISHVQTAREYHDLNMDFCGFKQLRVTNFYVRIVVYSWVNFSPYIDIVVLQEYWVLTESRIPLKQVLGGRENSCTFHYIVIIYRLHKPSLLFML